MSFDAGKMVSLDLETHLIEPGILAPRIVCGSWADAAGGFLLDREQAVKFARGLLDGGSVVVGANVAFDFGCLVAEDPALLPLVFRAYGEGRVFDVQVAQALHAIAEGNLYVDPRDGTPMKGRYSLKTCVEYVLGRSDAKANDQWRLRYALLDGVPHDQWPEEARQYPVDDAVNTLQVALAQVAGGGAGITPGPHRNLEDLPAQAEAAFAMHLGAMWGMRVDQGRVAELSAKVEVAHAEFVEKFAHFYKKGKTGELKRDGSAVKRAVVTAYSVGDVKPCASCVDGRTISQVSGNSVVCRDCSGTGLDPFHAPKTPTGGVCADRDSLVESGDEDLMALGDNEAEKIRDTYLPKLADESAVRSLRPNVLVASGRTSYDGIIQLLPRLGGVRECVRARPGRVLCSVDYAALELCTLAQVCLWVLGHSQMAETINATGDPGSLHTALAAAMAGVSAEEMAARVKAKDENARKYRQASKALNFGLPGGMGAAKLVFSKRKKSEGTTQLPDGTEVPGIRFCVLLLGAERCGVERVTEWRKRPTPPICRACVELVDRELRPAWFKQWPEVREYHDWVSKRVEAGGELPCLGTERVRGGLDFTNGANNGFQALAADGAKHALRALTRECYLDRESVLYGARPVFFLHDEVMSEMDEGTAHLAGPRKAELMVAAMRHYVPNVTIKAEPSLMRHWSKAAADPTYNAAGKLIPWEDR